MRNSLLPLLVTLLISAAVVAQLLLHQNAVQLGQAGPQLNPGLYEQMTTRVYQVPSMALNGHTSIALAGAPPAGPGLPVAGRFVVVSGDDAEPLTRAVMYALAERITATGGVAVLDPVASGAPVLPPPLDTSWCVRLRQIHATLPTVPGGSVQCVLRAHAWTVRLPADHPAADLQEGGVARALEATITHASTGQGPASWPRWYAAVGRQMAQELLAALAPGTPAVAPTGFATWPTTLPPPPQMDLLRWDAPFQRELLRGWMGHTEGSTTQDPAGRTVTEHERLATLLGHGGWKPATDIVAAGYRCWRRAADGALLSEHGLDAPTGEELIVWWERPHPAARFAAWLDAASSGVAPALLVQDRAAGEPTPAADPARIRDQARDCLARYLDCPAIPADLRARARPLAALRSPGGGHP